MPTKAGILLWVLYWPSFTVSNSLVCVPDSLAVINDGCFPSLPALIENTLGRTHWSCSKYIRIIISEFPAAVLDLLISENTLKFRMEMHGLGASLHLAEWWIYPKSARQALTAIKDATPLLMVVERPENDLTPSLMELMRNSLRPAI